MGYLHNRGDYGSYRGDPGILGTLGGVLGGVISNLVPGGSVVASTARALIGRATARPTARAIVPMPAMPAMPAMPRATVGKRGAPVKINAAGELVTKRRRMNVTNAKALRRAIRRTDGFVKLAKRALKGTGYTVSRRGSGRKGPRTIVESGAGSVVTR